MYSDYIKLNKEEVLKRITQEEIYQLVTNYLPVANKYVISPLRKNDKLAGSYFEWVKGYLYFKDWADPVRCTRDCFQVIMDYFNLSFNEALLLVDNHFELGISIGNPIPELYHWIDYSSKHNKMISSAKRSEKNNDLEIRIRQFNDYDKYYWYNRFGISKANLIEDTLFPINWYKFFSQKRNDWIVIRPLDICYSLDEFRHGYRKIYRPLSESLKWITNCTENHIGNIDNLPILGNKLIIEKSYKCARIIRNEDIRNVVWFQSESQYPKEEYLLPLCARFNKILVLYDNDEQGIIGSNKLITEINRHFPEKAESVFIQDKRVKDIGEMRERLGRKNVYEFLKRIY